MRSLACQYYYMLYANVPVIVMSGNIAYYLGWL